MINKEFIQWEDMGNVVIIPLNMESYDRLEEKGFEPIILSMKEVLDTIKDMLENGTNFEFEGE